MEKCEPRIWVRFAVTIGLAFMAYNLMFFIQQGNLPWVVISIITIGLGIRAYRKG